MITRALSVFRIRCACSQSWTVSGSYVTRLFQKIRKAGELPPLSFHGLPHCAASLMLASGADIAVVSKLIGVCINRCHE